MKKTSFSNLYSATLDGVIAGSSSERISLGAAASLQLPSFSAGVFYNVTTAAPRQCLIDMGGVNNTTVRFLIEAGGKLRLLLSNVRGLCIGLTTITTGVFQHAMVTYNSVTGACVIYLQGVSDGTATDAATMTYTSPTFMVGNVSTNNGEPVSGTLYHPHFYNTVLTADQVLAIKNNPYVDLNTLSGGGNLITALRFPNGTTDYPTWTDYKGVNHGTMINMESSDITTSRP